MSNDLNMQFAKKSAELSLELFEKLNASNVGKFRENIIFSPFSVQSCVALAHAGAEGETAEQISNGLKLVSNDKNEIGESFCSVLTVYQESKLVKIANKIYVQEGNEIKEEFNKLAKNKFYSEVEQINFAKSNISATSINEWVESKTNGKITNLVSADNLSAETRLVLINAIHFKGDWEEKFDKDNTLDDDFWVNEKESVQVPMMNKKAKYYYGYFEELNCKALEMPYKDSDLSMFVILPTEREGLGTLAAKLKTVNLVDLAGRMSKKEVVIKFPKFKVDYSVELNEPLRQMGVQKMFSSHAEFGNMLKSSQSLYVSKVLHKACIEVNEEGSEAAAATGMIMMMRCSFPSIRLEFQADHPFLYVIWDKKSILFAGSFVTAADISK